MNKIWILDSLINIVHNIFELNFNKRDQIEKQQPDVFYKKRCFWKFYKILKKTPSQSLFFNKVVALTHFFVLEQVVVEFLSICIFLH